MLTKEEKRLFKNCRDCMYADDCPKFKECEYLTPTQNDELSKAALLDAELIRMVTPASKVQKRILYGRKDQSLSDGGATLWEYYASNVNECLRLLRKGQIAYCYNLRVLQDVMKYEPDVKVQWQDDTYYMRLN